MIYFKHNHNRYNKIFPLIMSMAFISLTISCKKTIEIGSPPTKATLDKIFSDSTLLKQTVLNIYTIFGSSEAFVPTNGMYTDELNTTSTSTNTIDFFNNSLTSSSNMNAYWNNFYSTIYQANIILENLPAATNVSGALKTRIKGECEFLRAYSYLYLVNIWGDVPLILKSDINASAVASRTPMMTIYSQIISDLQDAENLLLPAYVGEEKVRATKYAAAALLARVYLYNKQYAQAEAEATNVINSGVFTPLPTTSNAFLKSSPEAIFQIWNVSGINSNYSVLIPTTATPSYYLTNGLYNSFEMGDLRKSSWTIVKTINSITYNCFYKYKQTGANTGANSEYACILRCAEQYLIRAEARTQQNNNLTGAIADLNVIRTRAGLINLSNTLTQSQILAAVMQERRVELFVENGHLFFDLKRWGTIDSVLGATKTNWHSYGQLYPLPKSDLTFNPSLTQNPGYN